MRILFFLLFPIFLSAQINRAYGVIEIGSFPTSSATGPKFAYRPIDSSFYRWVSGNTWVKVLPVTAATPDTLYLKQLSGTTAIVDGDTIDISTYLLHSDTSSMLDPYIKLAGYGLSKLVGHTLQVDTSVISTKTYTNRFLLKSDTAAMLLRYPSTTGFGFVDGGKTWSADSTKLATQYHVGANFFPLQGGTLTGTGGAGFIGFPSQVSAPGTPASGLNVYAQGSSFNWKGTDGYERQFASTLTGGRTYTLPNVSGTFALGTGTADRSARWSATNTLAAGNFTDNGTKLEALLPFQFQSWTTAGRPTGVNGYTGFNTSFNWLDIYLSTGWFSPMQSSLTGGLGTAGRVLYTDVNGRATDNGNLLFTGTRFQTAGSIRIGNSSHTDTASISKVVDNNAKIVRINNPGSSGAFTSGLVFRGGNDGTLASVETFRISTRSTTRPGAVYIGNVTEASAANAEATTSLGILNKVTSLGTFDAALNLHPATGLGGYSLAAGKQYGIFIGGETSTIFTNFSVSNTFGIFLGYQYQPTAAGYAGSFVVSAKNDGGTNRELARFQGKDGNLCLGCTNAQYHIYTDNTGAYGVPSGPVSTRPTFVASHPWFRFNTDSTQLEYAEAGGTIRQIASRAYARSLVSGLATTWLKTELEAGRDVDITGGTSTDFRLRSNTRTQLDGKFKVGSDSSFVHDPAQDTTYQKGNWRIQSGNLTIEKSSGTPYLNIIAKSAGNQEAGIYMKSMGTFGSLIEIDGGTSSLLTFYNYKRAATAGLNFSIGENNGFTGATSYGDFIVVDSTSNSATANRRFRFDSRGEAQFYNYGAGTKEAADLSKAQSNYIAGFATDGTVLDLERKRDTTVYIVDTDLDWSAAITTTQIASRYNRVVFLMTTTAAAGSNSDLTLHTPDVNLMQVEYLIRSTDEAGGFTNTIQFGTNNAVASDNTLASSYTPSPGQGVGIRAGLRSGTYKYWYY